MPRKEQPTLFMLEPVGATKHCSRCGQDLPVESFYESTRDGRSAYCKPCAVAYQAELRRARRNDVAPVDVLDCAQCGRALPASDFHKHSTGRGGRRRACRECSLERERERRAGRPRPRSTHCLDGDVVDPVSGGKKTCRTCGKWLPIASFGADRSRPSRLAYSCRACTAEYFREYNLRGGGLKGRLRKYGLSVDAYKRLRAAQGGRCAICREAVAAGGYAKRLCVDHDHDTGAVRGLLCRTCNLGIGFLRDDPGRLRAAIAYLAAPPAQAVLGDRAEAAS